MFNNQPKGLWFLALANTGERFGYYTMMAVFALFLQANFGFSEGVTSLIFSSFLMLVYFLPLFGGMLADKFGFSKMVTIGIYIMFAGYVLLSVPLGANALAIIAMAGALLLISLGTGLFKGNLQVMIGDLYNEARYSGQRDAGFSLFYMAINVGALFAPTAAIKIMKWAQESLGVSAADSYHFAFGVAFLSLIVSIIIYYIGKPTFQHVCGSPESSNIDNREPTTDNRESATDNRQSKIDNRQSKTENRKSITDNLSPAETRERIVCLCLVFAVVIFFWMAFSQNGLTLTFFARDYTATTSTGIQSMLFDVTNLVACIFIVFAAFSLSQSDSEASENRQPIIDSRNPTTDNRKSRTENRNSNLETRKSRLASRKLLPLGIIILALAFLGYKYSVLEPVTEVSAPIFQQFNACFVVMLTPVSIALFSWLAKKGKEPKAPVKIGLGMLVAAVAYLLMTVGSIGLPEPAYDAAGANLHMADASPYWLVSTYLVLTFAELLLSPIGISFVTKVAPPQYKGMMMGGWFVSTALGNFLVQIPGYLWGSSLYLVWGTLAVICLIAAGFIFSIIKKLNRVA